MLQAAPPLRAFFAQYGKRFTYNPSASPSEEFRRLTAMLGWKRDSTKHKAEHAFQEAFLHQFNIIYGTDVNEIALCTRLGVDHMPESIHERLQVQAVHSPRTALSFGDRVSINPEKPSISSDVENEASLKKLIAGVHQERVDELAASRKTIIMYTDGSLLRKDGFQKAGAGLVGYCLGGEIFAEKIRMGEWAGTHDAEMAALMFASKIATRLAVNNPGSINRLCFYTDNANGAATIFNAKLTKSGQLYSVDFHTCICTFLDADPTNRVEIGWCPSHSNIKGNARADDLAKEARQVEQPLPISIIRLNAKRQGLGTKTVELREDEKTEDSRAW